MICCCGSFGDHEKYSVDIFSVRFTGQPCVLVWFNIFVENFYKWQSHGWCWCMTIDNVQLKREIIGQSRLRTQICRGVSPENSRNKIKAIKTNIWTLFCPINTPKLSCFDLIKIFTRYLWFSEILSILAWADLTFFIRHGIDSRKKTVDWMEEEEAGGKYNHQSRLLRIHNPASSCSHPPPTLPLGVLDRDVDLQNCGATTIIIIIICWRYVYHEWFTSLLTDDLGLNNQLWEGSWVPLRDLHIYSTYLHNTSIDSIYSFKQKTVKLSWFVSKSNAPTFSSSSE